MNHKTQIQTYIKNNKSFLWFAAGAGFMLLIAALTLGALGQQTIRVEKQRLTYADVFPKVNQLVRGREIKATVTKVAPSQENSLVVRLNTTGKKVPVNTTQATDIQKRIPKDKETYQQEVEEFQEKIQSGNLKGVKQPKSYTTKDIEFASLSERQQVVIKPRENVIGRVTIPAEQVSVLNSAD